MEMKQLLHDRRFLLVGDYFKKMNFADRSVYANWLAQTYYFVKHSVRLSALGAARCDIDSTLGKRMIAHTMEERGHHMLALKDLEGLGHKIEEYPEFGLTKVFYQSQYYRVLFDQPASLLGQIFMLEGFAAIDCEWLYNTVSKEYGETASRFVKVHAFEDPDHVDKALEEMNRFSDDQKVSVIDNFGQACEMYYCILQSINEGSFLQKVGDQRASRSADQPREITL